MKFKFILFLLVFSFHLSYSQKKKYYLDQYSKQITKREFNNFDNIPYEYIRIAYENDTAKVNKIEIREVKGKLDKNTHNAIIQFLARKDAKVVDDSKTIIINYYPGRDQCNSTGNPYYVIDLYKNFLAEIKFDRNVNQYFFYNSSDGLDFFQGYFNWLEDDDKLFEKQFFPLHYPWGSYVIIYPNGDYYVYKGEYYILDILHKIR